MSSVEMLGFLAGLFFMASAVPLAWSSIKAKKSDAPWSTVFLVMTGALLMMLYGYLIHAIPLVVDMSITFSCWATISVVKIRQYQREHKKIIVYKEIKDLGPAGDVSSLNHRKSFVAMLEKASNIKSQEPDYEII